MKKLLPALFLAFILSGCASLPFFPNLHEPNRPKTLYKWNETETRTPVAVGKDAEGNIQVVDKVERTVSANLDTTPGKKTLGQIIGGWIAGLSISGLIFIVVSLVFFGGAPIVWVVGKFFKARAALKATVAAIEQMNAEDKEKLKIKLAQTQDTKDKEYVAKLKAEIASQQFKSVS